MPAEIDRPAVSEDALRRKVRTLAVPTILSFVLVIVVGTLLVTKFDTEFAASWTRVRASRWGFYLVAILLYYLEFPLRGLRWKLHLEGAHAFDAATKRPTIFEHGLIILMNWAVNCVAFFRLGDAYRAYFMNRRYGTGFSRGIGTIVAERVMDLIVVLPFVLLAGIGLLLDRRVNRTVGIVVLSAVTLGILGGLFLIGVRLFASRAARFLPKQLQYTFLAFQQGVGSMHHLPMLVALTIGIWVLEASRLYFVIQALQLHVGLAMVLFAALAASLLTIIPFTPGGLVFVEAGLTGLLALALTQPEAQAVTILDRSITYVSIIAVGGIVLLIRSGWEFKRRRKPPATST